MEPSHGVSETMNGALTTAEPVALWEKCTLVWIDGVPHLRLAESCPLVAHLLARPPLSSLGRRERIELDPALRTLKYGGREARLTETEFKMASRLVASIGSPVSFEELLQDVWGYIPARAGNALVRVHVVSLRRKLRNARIQGVTIDSVRGKGYRLYDIEHYVRAAFSTTDVRLAE